MIVFLGTKNSRTKLFKKRLSSRWQKILAFFPRMIQCEKPHGTINKGPKAILTGNLELKRACFWDLTGCWKHKFLKKKASSPVKKMFWPCFSRIIEHDKRQRTTYKGTQGFLTSLVQAIWSFFVDLGSREANFSKKGCLPGDKFFGTFFS